MTQGGGRSPCRDSVAGSARGDRGSSFALLAALLFGVSAPFAKALLRNADPQLLAGLLYLGSGTGLALMWLRRRQRGSGASLSRRDLPWLAGAIAVGGILGPVLLLLGLMRTPASSTSLLLNLEGVFTALLAWFAFHENFDRRIALGMLAIVAGGAVISGEGRLAWGGLGGPLLVTAACLAWAVDNNLTQKVSAGDPVQIAMLKGLIAGAVNSGLAVWLGAAWPGIPSVGAALLLGFLSYGLSLVLFVLALRHLGTARTGAYFSVAPFFGAAVAILGFGERPTPLFLAGSGLTLVGVWVHLTERHLHRHTHAALEHEHAHVHDEHHRHSHAPDDSPGEPHTHPHRHEPLVHTHRHYPDIHHRHLH